MATTWTKVKEEDTKRLPKRLLYVMRYGALKEGLDVDSNGYVDIKQVLTVPLLTGYSQDEVMNEVKTSVSYRKTPRYEWRERDKKTYIRAAYLRKFEKSPFHPGTQVKTLMEASMNCVLQNLDMFDLEDFQDEYTIKLMIHRLKRQRTITNKALSVLFVPTLTRLDLEGIYLTNNTLRLMWSQCPHLRGLSLKNCGYIITDTVLTQVVKNLPKLEQLNLSRCAHLTDQCLPMLAKRLPHLQVLHLAGVPSINPKAVHCFLNAAKELKFLDVFYMRKTDEEYESLMECATQRGVQLILHSPKEGPLKEERISEDEDGKNDEDELLSDGEEVADDDDDSYDNDYNDDMMNF